MVYARGRCVRHGGKKTCLTPGCASNVRGGGFCTKHGGRSPKRYCIVEGCQKQAHAHQKCVRHGGGRYCREPGCRQHIRVGGYCSQHKPTQPTEETVDAHVWEAVLNNLVEDCSITPNPDEDWGTLVKDLDGLFIMT
ncbi:hypothetical protein LEN26_008911 [Aphanomyces euteiches]|nr:hypothetical protein LEN26_008911 [Aphanomyces euteiches]